MDRTKGRSGCPRWGRWAFWVVAAALGPAALAQSVILDDDRLIIQDASATTRVEIGTETIVEAIEIRVLGPGPDIQALINGILDASAAKHYVIRLGPGEYVLSSGLVMKPFVSLVGSGRQSTFLRAGAAIISVVSGADDMALTDMTIENSGGAASTWTIFNSSASPTIARVTVIASGGNSNRGVYNSSSSPVMRDVTATAIGAETDQLNVGIHNLESSPEMTRVIASASEGIVAYGVYNQDSSSPVMRIVTASASDAGSAYAVYNRSSSSPTMTGVTATASGGNNNGGVYNEESSSPVMRDVAATASGAVGTSYGVRNKSSSPKMTNVTATASQGLFSYGVSNESSSPVMTGVIATGSGGDTSRGVSNGAASSPIIMDSVAKAENAALTNTGIHSINSSTRVYSTLVVGGVANDDAGTQCHGVYDDTPAPIGC